MAAPQPAALAPAPTEHDAAATHIISHRVEEYTTSDEVSEKDTSTPALEDELRHKDITTIARSFSNLSENPSSVNDQNEPINTFLHPSGDPSLDPNSDQFSSLKWVRNMLQMTRDPDRYPKRTAGVSFRNLNVFGYGSGADYQITFGNAWLKMFNWAKGQAGYGKKHRIDILRDFEGMVHAGEMLVVLGRPGR